MDVLKKNGNKYLIFNYSVNVWDVWDGIKNEIKAINGGKENDYGKDYKPLKLHAMTIIIRSVFEGGKLYLQVFLNDALYEV